MSRPSRTNAAADRTPHGSSVQRAIRAGTVVGLAALALCPTACDEPAPRRPNVLIYVIDTLRADGLASYGNAQASTPHLDALASEGVLFENAYANASWTRASVATLLTGLLPWHHGAESRDDRLPELALTLAEIFAEQGYATALVSANPNVGRVFGFQQAFDDLSELFARSKPGLVQGRELVTPSDVVTRDAVAWLRGAQQPFFLVVLAIDPHFPYRPPPRHDPARQHTTTDPAASTPVSQVGIEERSPESERRARELYQGEIAFNDESFGALVAAMQQLGIWDDTLVVVTADHGEEFWEYDMGGHGKTLTEEVLRVPMIIRDPQNAALSPGTRMKRRIALVDLVPTLLGLVGISPPDDLDGTDWFAARDEPSPPSLAGLDLDGRHLLAAVDDHYKLVWDLKSDRRNLYDLRSARPDATPIDPASSPEAQHALEALTAAIAVSVSDTGRTLDKSRVDALPEDVEQSLRALGYID
jgi:arylsulfatase A-like enzyme